MNEPAITDSDPGSTLAGPELAVAIGGQFSLDVVAFIVTGAGNSDILEPPCQSDFPSNTQPTDVNALRGIA